EYVKTVVTAAGNVSISDGEYTYRIGSVLKHFPGYGNNVDTHTGIAIDQRPYEQFVAEDFLPFQAGIEAGTGSVMVSHNIVKCMDEDFPSSLSPEVHRVLREELGFEGVILTDDLAMDAVEAYAKDGSVAVLAVLAGNDMIVTTDFEKQIPLGIEAVQTGVIEESIIDSAVRRVLGWKYDLGLIE
ncbi:MAG: beta-hexosaminidase, partial [Oscillospiraceae bacterium]|nr:beta-hexosaminidase [Oscillospiraceae bacterium]